MCRALSILLTLIIVIIEASVTGAGADQDPLDIDSGIISAKYRGDISVTISGLKCLNWSRLNRTIHTVTIDR